MKIKHAYYSTEQIMNDENDASENTVNVWTRGNGSIAIDCEFTCKTIKCAARHFLQAIAEANINEAVKADMLAFNWYIENGENLAIADCGCGITVEKHDNGVYMCIVFTSERVTRVIDQATTETATTETATTENKSNVSRITLYVGLNDQKEKVQLIPTETALKLVSNACVKYVEGATIYQAIGVYKYASGQVVTENTFRIEIIEPGAGLVDLVEYLKTALNQESIIIQRETINSDFI